MGSMKTEIQVKRIEYNESKQKILLSVVSQTFYATEINTIISMSTDLYLNG